MMQSFELAPDSLHALSKVELRALVVVLAERLGGRAGIELDGDELDRARTEAPNVVIWRYSYPPERLTLQLRSSDIIRGVR